MKWIPLLLPTLFVLALATTGLAAEEGTIRLQSIAEIEVEKVDADGNRVVERIIAEKVMPETEVIYTNRFTNIGTLPATGLVLTNPIPEQMVYIEDSALGAQASITFSVDGGKNFDSPGALMVLGEDGKMRTAQASDYTHIRWQINTSLPPDETDEVSFRAMLQ